MKKDNLKELVRNIIANNTGALATLAQTEVAKKTDRVLADEKKEIAKLMFLKKKVNVKEGLESNIDILAKLQEILEKELPDKITLENGEVVEVDMPTANILVTVFNALNDENRGEMKKLLQSSLINFMKVVDFAYKNTR